MTHEGKLPYAHKNAYNSIAGARIAEPIAATRAQDTELKRTEYHPFFCHPFFFVFNHLNTFRRSASKSKRGTASGTNTWSPRKYRRVHEKTKQGRKQRRYGRLEHAHFEQRQDTPKRGKQKQKQDGVLEVQAGESYPTALQVYSRT